MRIAHVATLVSPDGAYGGPVRVAVNQLKQLARMGHDVQLFATRRGFSAPPAEVDGVPVSTYPLRQVLGRSGYAGATSASLLWQIRRDLGCFDVAHVHLTRDLVTLPAAWLALDSKVPLFVQAHGMVDSSDRLLSRPLDALVTRRVLIGAHKVFYLTESEKSALQVVSRSRLNLEHLVNGVPDAAPAVRNDEAKLEILFLARLHPIKRAETFVQAAIKLSKGWPDVRFRLVGPDGGDGAKIKSLIASAKAGASIHWEGPIKPEGALERIRQSDIYVLPSSSDVFPMSVLEAASVGTPVVVNRNCGLAESIEKHGAGLVTGLQVDELAGALHKLLSSPELRRKQGLNARRMVRELYSMEQVGASLAQSYSEALG